MGCSLSQLVGIKNDDTLLEKKLDIKDSSIEKSFKKKRSFRSSPSDDPCENYCNICEYDDKIRDVRMTGVSLSVPLSDTANCLNVSASLITAGSSYDLDEKYEMSHAAIIAASHSSQNLHSADSIDTAKVLITAYPHHGNPIIPSGYAINPHGVSNFRLHSDGATADVIDDHQHSETVDEGDSPDIDTSCDSIPSPTSVTGTSHLDGFSSPFSSAPTSPTCLSPTLSPATRAAWSNAMSPYDDNLHGISKTVGKGPPTAAKSNPAIGAENDKEKENCLQSPSTVVPKGFGSAVRPNISILSALDGEAGGGNEEFRDDDGECSRDACEEHDLPDHISLIKLALPPVIEMTMSPANQLILQTLIPLACSPEISASDLQKGDDEDEEYRHSISSSRSSKSISSRDADAIRESVKTSVSKIEVLSKGRKPPALHVNTSWEAEKSSRTALLLPLSPNKFPPRNIASIGRYSSSEKSGEVYIVGGFRDTITSTKAPTPKVKDIVAKIQSVKSIPPPRSLNQYFTPIPQKNRHKKDGAESLSRPVSISEIDDLEFTRLTAETKVEKVMRRSIGSLVSRTDYTVALKPPIINSKSFDFSPTKEMDIHRLTTSEASRNRRSADRWEPIKYVESIDLEGRTSDLPTLRPTSLGRAESVQSLLSYTQ